MFVKEYGNKSVFCSIECRKSAARDWNKAAKMVRENRIKAVTKELVSSKRIYIRDGYRCGICGKKLRMDKKAPHPLSPSIDHIVPLSCGGEHSYRNVRAAHFQCNSLRGACSTGNDQLLMFGL
jgi:5-methylcytosine-specific restriction endonuclease McrA